MEQAKAVMRFTNCQSISEDQFVEAYSYAIIENDPEPYISTDSLNQDYLLEEYGQLNDARLYRTPMWAMALWLVRSLSAVELNSAFDVIDRWGYTLYYPPPQKAPVSPEKIAYVVPFIVKAPNITSEADFQEELSSYIRFERWDWYFERSNYSVLLGSLRDEELASATPLLREHKDLFLQVVQHYSHSEES